MNNFSAQILKQILLICLLSLNLFACSEEQTLRVGSNQWPGYEPLYLARDLDAFNRSDINLVELPSATDVMQYIRNGGLEGGMLTLDEVITLIAEGIPLRVVLVLDESQGADAVLAQPEITSVAELRGKRVGVEVSALGALMLDALIKTAELVINDIVIVPLTVDQQESAFQSGDVDAVITFEPTRCRLLASGAVEIFDSSQIPGRIIDVLAVREEVLQQQKGHLQTLLSGYFQARDYMQREPDAAATRMAPRLAMDGSTLQQAYQGLSLPDLTENYLWLAADNPKILESAMRLSKLMKRQGLIGNQPDLEQLADARFLPKD